MNHSGWLQALRPGSSDSLEMVQWSPFDLYDIAAATGIPFILFLLLISYANPDERFEISVFTIGAGVISLLAARFLIWTRVKSGFWQGFWQIFTSIVALVPAVFFALWIFP